MHSHLTPALHDAVGAEIERGRVWRVQMDTYEREVERYGGPDGLLLSERIFEIDSDAAASLAQLSITGRLRAADRWRVALVGADRLLADLGVEPIERRKLLETLRDAYRAEHGLEPPFARQISDRFREERPRLASIFSGADESGGIRDALEVLRSRSERLASLAVELRSLASDGRLTEPLPQFAANHVHMSMTRQLRSSLRAQEAVIYDFLSRFYADPRFFTQS